MMKNLLLVTAAGALFAGCSMVPEYKKPAAPVSAHYPLGQQSGGTAAADIQWRDFFDDARLEKLVALALENNRDLRIAALRVEQTRAQYRIRRSDLFPSLDAGAGAFYQRTPGTLSPTGSHVTSESYDVSVGAAFELDLFGRVRSLKEEALERYLATEESRKSTHIALVSEVATQYLALLQLQEARILAEQTLKAVQDSYDLNKRSFEAGVASELDLRTAETQVQSARVDVSNFNELIARAENALVFLVGQPLPNDLPDAVPLGKQGLLTDLPSGVPSDLLQRRPDILAAEHNLKAANANIGAARAAFFPRILLTGSAGTASASLTDLFTGPSAAWSFAPQMTVPIFNAGRNKANLDVSEVGKKIEVATYERTIQTAFREVADALAVRSFVDAKLKSQQQLVRAQQQRFDLTNARYRQGVDSYVDVLLAQRDLYAAQQNLIQFQAARLQNAVTLYRSLGGGWNSQG